METTQHKLYGGRITLDYDDARHFYTRDGNSVQGVTSILNVIDKPGLPFWAVSVATKYIQNKLTHGQYTKEDIQKILDDSRREHERIRNQAAQSGREIHKVAENIILGTKYEAFKDPEVEGKIQSFNSFIQEKQVEFIDTERVVYSEEYNFCGTFDFTCKIAGKKYLGDLKTGKAIHTKFFLQTAAYQQALFEETGEQLDGRCILRVGKDGYELVFRDNKSLEGDYEAFKSALLLSRWVEQND